MWALEISNIQVLAAKATNYPVPNLAIYKNNKKGSRLAALYKFTLKASKVRDSVHQGFGSIAIRIPSGANQNFWLRR